MAPKPKSAAQQQPAILRIYGRNVELMSFKTGISMPELAKRLDISANALSRIRFGRSKYIDPAVLDQLCGMFNCTYQDLLTQQEGVNYDNV